MRSENLIAFLESADVRLSTKKARLSHLRRLLQALHATYPQEVSIQAMYEQSKLIKVKRNPDSESVNERNKTALARQQVYKAFAVWQEDRIERYIFAIGHCWLFCSTQVCAGVKRLCCTGMTLTSSND